MGSGRMTACARRRLEGEVARHDLVTDEHPARLESPQEAAGDEIVPTGRERFVDLPMDDPITAIDEAGRIAKRAWLPFESWPRVILVPG